MMPNRIAHIWRWLSGLFRGEKSKPTHKPTAWQLFIAQLEAEKKKEDVRFNIFGHDRWKPTTRESIVEERRRCVVMDGLRSSVPLPPPDTGGYGPNTTPDSRAEWEKEKIACNFFGPAKWKTTEITKERGE